VTLNGEVSSREEKRRAEDLAESVSGVGHVQNNLRVKGRSGSTSTAGGLTNPASGNLTGSGSASGGLSRGATSGSTETGSDQKESAGARGTTSGSTSPRS
jgi:hypothetical protein